MKTPSPIRPRRGREEQDLRITRIIIPRVLTIPDAARYLSATTNFVEQLLNSGEVNSFIQGKARVVACLELDKYIERRNTEPAVKLTARTANLKAVA
jgi:hypothetical protein